MKIDGRFWLTKKGQNFLGSGRIELLKKIEKSGSISAAAKEMKMSYKAAWERINGMNELADEVLITRTIGGKGGGGTTLTPYAHKLIATYQRFNELHRQFIDRFAEAGDDPEHLARILGRTFLTTSARNQFRAKIISVNTHGLHTDLALEIAGGGNLISRITTTSVRNMALEVEREIYAIIKSSDISIVNEAPDLKTNLNIQEGIITSLKDSGDSIEVSIALNELTTLVALLNKESANSFKVGEKAYALISHNNIIIGS